MGRGAKEYDPPYAHRALSGAAEGRIRASLQVALDFGQAGDHQAARAGAGIGAREGNPSVEPTA
jgi:hypothetical protein